MLHHGTRTAWYGDPVYSLYPVHPAYIMKTPALSPHAIKSLTWWSSQDLQSFWPFLLQSTIWPMLSTIFHVQAQNMMSKSGGVVEALVSLVSVRLLSVPQEKESHSPAESYSATKCDLEKRRHSWSVGVSGWQLKLCLETRLLFEVKTLPAQYCLTKSGAILCYVVFVVNP